MALFKQLRGNRAALDSQPLTDGYAYFCVDDGTFHIDFKDDNGVLKRKQINAKNAENLMGTSLSTILNSSDVEIPTSKAVFDALEVVEQNVKDYADVHKHATEENWLKTSEFTPKQGELIVYDSEDVTKPARFKIGDGITNVSDLPFADNNHLPISNSIGEGSIIGNDLENNKAYGNYTTAMGYDTSAGSNAFKIVDVNVADKIIAISSVVGIKEILDSESAIQYSCQLSENYDLCGNITDVDETNKTITVDIIPNSTTTTGILWIPSHPELGDGETIVGTSAFATGYGNRASQECAFVAGCNNIAAGKYSIVSGDSNTAGYASAVFGKFNKGHQWSLIGGYQNTLTAPFAFSAGGNNTVSAKYGNALGHSNTIEGEASFVTGTSSTVKSINSLASGVNNTIEATAKESLAVGSNNIIKAPHSAAIGFKHTINASANGRAFAAGSGNTVSHNFSAAIGCALTTSRDSQIVVGRQNINDSTAMFIVGNGTSAEALSNAFVVKDTGDVSVLGSLYANGVTTSGKLHATAGATISGDLYANAYTGTSGKVVINSSTNTATGDSSFSGGNASQALGRFSFAFGNGSIAGTTNDNGKYTVAIGFKAKATHDGAVAIGWDTKAFFRYSTALGNNTQTATERQLVCGTWNTLDTNSAFIIGNGTADTNRNYAFNVHKNGQAYLGSADIDETNDKSIVTKKYVDNKAYSWKDIKDTPDISTDGDHKTNISGNNVYAYANDTLDLNSSVITNIYANGEVNIGSTNIDISAHESMTLGSTYGTVAVKNLVDPIKDTDAANKKYVDTVVGQTLTSGLSKQLVTAVNGNKVTIDGVETDAVENVIYLLKDENAVGEDIYKEYTLVGDPAVLTLIGSTSVNLSSYATKDDIDRTINSIYTRNSVIDANIINITQTLVTESSRTEVSDDMVVNTICDLSDTWNFDLIINNNYYLVARKDLIISLNVTSDLDPDHGSGFYSPLDHLNLLSMKVNNNSYDVTCNNNEFEYSYNDGNLNAKIKLELNPAESINISNGDVISISFKYTGYKNHYHQSPSENPSYYYNGTTYQHSLVNSNIKGTIRESSSINCNISKSITETSLIGNDLENNKAYGNNATAMGKYSISGTRCFTITATSVNESNHILVSLDSVDGIEVGQECRFKTNSEYYSEVLEINGNNVTLNALNSSAYDLDLYTANINKGEYTDSENPYLVRLSDGTDSEKNSFFIIGYPEIGTDRILGTNAASFGSYNNASALSSFVAGNENNALGGFSAVFGTTNTAGYGSVVGGRSNDARLSEYGATFGYGNKYVGKSNHAFAAGGQNELNGAYTVALGGKNKINGVGSSALGIANEINSNYSNAFGYYNKTNSNYQVAVGTYNEPIVDALFMVGNGTKNSRSNAFVVQKDGDVLIPRTATIYGELNLAGPMTASDMINANKGIVSTVYSGTDNAVVLNTGANKAIGKFSIAGGANTNAKGYYSTALGYYTIADKVATFVAGANNASNANYQTIFGSYANNTTDSLFTVGNGSSSAKSNAFDVTKDGRAYLGNADILDDEKAVATKKYVDSKFVTDQGVTVKLENEFNSVDLGPIGMFLASNYHINIDSNEVNINTNPDSGSTTIKNVVEPIEDGDAVNKKYVDNNSSSYETGIWTPIFKNTDKIRSIEAIIANYIKIGNQVNITLHCEYSWESTPTIDGLVIEQFAIAGLPFSRNHLLSCYPICNIHEVLSPGNANTSIYQTNKKHIEFSFDQNEIYLRKNEGSGEGISINCYEDDLIVADTNGTGYLSIAFTYYI